MFETCRIGANRHNSNNFVATGIPTDTHYKALDYNHSIWLQNGKF